VDVVRSVELTEQLHAVAFVLPCGQLAAVQAKRNGCVHRKGVVFAEEVVRRCVRAFHGALLNGVDHAERWHQFTTGVNADFELAARHALDCIGKHVCRTEDGVQRLGEAGGEAPANSGLCMHCGCSTCGQHTGNASVFNEGTTIHSV